MIPGESVQESLEAAVEACNVAVVLVGPTGVGPWQDQEIRGVLHEFLTRKLRVIPVLLPGATAVPRLPLFLKGFAWVDFRNGINDGDLARLEWGITGVKPQSGEFGCWEQHEGG